MKHIDKILLLALVFACNLAVAQWSWNTVNMSPVQRMQSVNFLTEDTGYAIMAADPNGARTLEKTTDGGATWTMIPLPIMAGEFQAQHFHADGAGVVVFRDLQNTVVPTKIFQTQDDGQNWLHISPDSTATGMGTAACQFLDQDTGFFATDAFLYATVDGGANWTTHAFTVYPMAISFHDGQHGTIGTFDGTFNYFGGMLTTTNGGQTWTQVDLNINGSVIGTVKQLSPTVSIAAPTQFGAYGQHQFYRSTNNGASWDTIPVPNTLPNSQLAELDFWDELRGIVTVSEIGGPTFSYATSDGGSTWTYFDSLQGVSVSDLQVIGNTGYLAGGQAGVFHKLSLGMSIAEEDLDPIGVYPNPAVSGQTIRIAGAAAFGSVDVIDVSGKSVHASDLQGNALELPALPSGIYFLRLAGPEGVRSAKLRVE